ncbi:Protein of unknown function [Pseudonocardia thermophila]|uniref:DUF3710 domain-containing protein n=2 Tax=Pseudonocardia thermophila TaxID=1848 RepID=A0A1M6ZLY0_PSETH|nr:Protein of unknown function [Pseudonocardia thermophila]
MPQYGPYDVDDADPAVSAAPNVHDFGALRVPIPPAGRVHVEPAGSGKTQAVTINVPGGRLSVSALAAPKSSKLWPDLAKEIVASLREGGARVRSSKGEWGRELVATTGAATSVFIGVDGPRWMVYGVATGPTEQQPALDAQLRELLRGLVVVRGKAPYPPRTVLPLTVPDTLPEPEPPAAAAAPVAPAEQQPAPPPSAPAPGAPASGAPVSRVPAAGAPVPEAEPAMGGRVTDAPATGVPPAEEPAAVGGPATVGPDTSAWPIDEATGRPRTPEWTAGQPAARRRSGPPIAEVAAEITQPILLSAIRGETPDPGPAVPPRDTWPEPVPDAPVAAPAPVADPIGDPVAEEPPVTTRLPTVPPRPADDGIDAFFGWDRPARPSEPAPEPEPALGVGLDTAAAEPFGSVPPQEETRWRDEPGVTTAWEAVGTEAAPVDAAASTTAASPVDWTEWARQELDRAVAERADAAADPAPVDTAPADTAPADTVPADTVHSATELADSEPADSEPATSFWERYGLPEPVDRTGGRHGADEQDEPGVDGGPAPAAGPDTSRFDTVATDDTAVPDTGLDPFTARRRARAAERGEPGPDRTGGPAFGEPPRRATDPAEPAERGVAAGAAWPDRSADTPSTGLYAVSAGLHAVPAAPAEDPDPGSGAEDEVNGVAMDPDAASSPWLDWTTPAQNGDGGSRRRARHEKPAAEETAARPAADTFGWDAPASAAPPADGLSEAERTAQRLRAASRGLRPDPPPASASASTLASTPGSGAGSGADEPSAPASSKTGGERRTPAPFAGWTAGWPGSGGPAKPVRTPEERRVESTSTAPTSTPIGTEHNGTEHNGTEQYESGGGRRRADRSGTRLTVAELAQKAGRGSVTPRRRRSRPDPDQPTGV